MIRRGAIEARRHAGNPAIPAANDEEADGTEEE